MKKEEYDIKMVKLYEAHQLARRELMKEFAYANNTVEVGDIVIDHSCKILVQQIKVYVGPNTYPECRYDGIELKVDNTPKRNNIKSSVYQGNLEHHFKKLTTP